MSAAAIWLIAGASIAGVLFRPKEWPEAVWASAGALLLIMLRLIRPQQAGAAVAQGTDVYLFLTGMMLLAELARHEGVFDWLASLAAQAARGSRARLFTLIYLVGIVVTVFLSNDATAVVLTPAVYAAVRKVRSETLPYLLICAFIANAASFVLPISNPANLVVYGKHLPALWPWLRTFFVPSVCSMAATYVALRWWVREQVRGSIEATGEPTGLSSPGRRAAFGILGTGAVLLCASALGRDLGLPTCISAVVAVTATAGVRPRSLLEIARGVSWSVLPLVAGLFIIVKALNGAGALQAFSAALLWCSGLPRWSGGAVAGFGVAALSNLMNNLPSGLLAGAAVNAARTPLTIRDSVLIGVDLGPNLSVTGSLATVLWLIALRREGERISAWAFLKAGVVVMTPALLLSLASLLLLHGSA